MTNTQLYFATGAPVFAIIVNMMANIMQITTINARITSLESSMNTRFDTLLGKVIDIDNRLTRLEERLEHH
ncbi:MAG TPA: hypothetical protein VEF06_15115 [Bryobacteraceae bacterium]|nr:hypothetical protein [Bryobacteraceae bacterium]